MNMFLEEQREWSQIRAFVFPEVNSSCFYLQASRESADYNEDNIHQLKSKFQFEAML